MKKAVRLLICFAAAAAMLPAATYYVTVAGLGGEEDYEQRFANWAGDLDKVFRETGGEVEVRTLRGA
ncbi:MAG: hypothetical protein GY953_37645, partial [bacterium]|nr:hypothetical protein [bacterium]